MLAEFGLRDEVEFHAMENRVRLRSINENLRELRVYDVRHLRARYQFDHIDEPEDPDAPPKPSFSKVAQRLPAWSAYRSGYRGQNPHLFWSDSDKPLSWHQLVDDRLIVYASPRDHRRLAVLIDLLR